MLALLLQTIAMLLYGTVVVGAVALVVLCLSEFFRHISKVNKMTGQQELDRVISGGNK